MNTLTQKANNAFKWSSITEIAAKLISPITNMLLARILAPEAFGILATVTMVISFAEVFVESGFNKFLIQNTFDSQRQEHSYLSTAFWANLIFSMFVWSLIWVFNSEVAKLAGNPGLGHLLVITGVTIPLYGIVGIQNAQIRRRLEFKKLFFVRLSSTLVPLVITIPLALIGFNFWALIIGNISSVLIRCIVLFFIGKFKPALCLDAKILKHMLSFGTWTMLDAIAIWATNWIDSLLISNFLNEYYLGLYRNSIGTLNSIFNIVIAAFTPVMFVTLSKIKDNQKEFNSFFLSVQKMLSTFLLPLGMGVFLYRHLATQILFGNKWSEAANIIGVFAIASSLRTIFISLYSDAYRAKGKFKLPLLMQIIDLCIMVPACLISVKGGFWSLVYTRAAVRLDLIIPEIICVWLVCRISIKDTLANIWHSILATVVMSVTVIALQQISTAIWWSFLSIIIAVIMYFSTLFLFKEEREKYLVSTVTKIHSIFRKNAKSERHNR